MVPLDEALGLPLVGLTALVLLVGTVFATVMLGCGAAVPLDAVACPTRNPAAVNATMRLLMAVIQIGPISNSRDHPLFGRPSPLPLPLIVAPFSTGLKPVLNACAPMIACLLADNREAQEIHSKLELTDTTSG